MSIINALPTAPSRADPTTFSDRADAHVAALHQFVDETNTVAAEVNANASTAASSASVCMASANFKGNYSSLTGALAVPAAVLYADKIWLLNTNTSNVTADVPGVSSKWTDATTLLGNVTLTGAQTISGVKTFSNGIVVNADSTFAYDVDVTGVVTADSYEGSGAALTDIPLLGVGQTHTDVTASRAFTTVYSNTTTKPIHVSIALAKTATSFTSIVGYVGSLGVTAVNIQDGTAAMYMIVPPSATYHVDVTSGTSITIASWIELR